MATEKDLAFVRFIEQETDAGKIRWEPTAENDQFTASFKGKYSVIVGRQGSEIAGQRDYYWIAIVDTEDRELLRLHGSEVNLVNLFRKTQRSALNVDQAIDEIMG